ncbi:MAG: 50S ribosomal protein L17 [Candidatus Levybacteria bacterium]|nr:50S ribosomal protein L17 [Candidatus Levybacteria bacterium]
MRKNVFGRKFKRDVNQRQALLKSLMSSLVMHGKIKTTEAKSKAIKGEVDKLVTRARKDVKLARKLLEPHLSAEAVNKFLLQVAPVFKDRNSGFTKTVRLGQRLKDNASLVLMTWTDEVQLKTNNSKLKTEEKKISKKTPVKKAAKKTKVATPARKPRSRK